MTASPTAGQPADLPLTSAEALPPAADDTEGPATEKRGRRRKLVVLLVLLLALVTLLGLALWYLMYREPLPSIPVLPAVELPSYSTAMYGVDRPIGVAVTADGSRVYVAESSGERTVKILDQGGNKIGAFKLNDTAADRAPVYLAIDPLTSEVYVSDRSNGTLDIYDSNGTYKRTFAPAVARPGWQPLGITFAPDGTLYVTDLAGETPSVVAFDRQAQVVREIGAAERMSFPNGLALDKAGNLYVTDSNNGRLLVFDSTGKQIARIGRGADTGKLGLPRGIAIDGQDRVFVVDTTGQGVQVDRGFQGNSQLEYLGTFGAQGVGDGQFSFPNGIAVDGRGHIYVADSANDRVQVWSY